LDKQENHHCFIPTSPKRETNDHKYVFFDYECFIDATCTHILSLVNTQYNDGVVSIPTR
jgi:hypothetical protein